MIKLIPRSYEVTVGGFAYRITRFEDLDLFSILRCAPNAAFIPPRTWIMTHNGWKGVISAPPTDTSPKYLTMDQVMEMLTAEQG